MDLYRFMNSLGLHKPLLAVQGDIFETPADHIAFAVHYPTKQGSFNNAGSGFSAQVAKYGWPELKNYEFLKGVPISKKIKGKYFHALPIHTNEENGWDDAPMLIRQCLNKLAVNSNEVIACVLMGGGNAGLKYGATVRNIEGMVKSYKTVVLYVNDKPIFNVLIGTGVVAQFIPREGSLLELPKVIQYRESAMLELSKTGTSN